MLFIAPFASLRVPSAQPGKTIGLSSGFKVFSFSQAFILTAQSHASSQMVVPQNKRTLRHIYIHIYIYIYIYVSLSLSVCLSLSLSLSTYRPQYTINIMGTPKKGAPMYCNPYYETPKGVTPNFGKPLNPKCLREPTCKVSKGKKPSEAESGRSLGFVYSNNSNNSHNTNNSDNSSNNSSDSKNKSNDSNKV